jgi:RNA polymerase sigma factor (sigma-70 family)
MPVTTSALEIVRTMPVESREQFPAEFWALVEQYRAELINQALSITGNLDDAEEVVQETFCEVFRQREKMKDVKSLGAWLRTVNRDNALDHIRSQKRDSQKNVRKQMLAPDRVLTTGGFSILEMRDMVAKAVEHLNPRMRKVVVLCYWEHLTPDEIAKRLNVSSRTVRRLLFEASLVLFGKLGTYLPDAPPPQAPAPESTSSDGEHHDADQHV